MKKLTFLNIILSGISFFSYGQGPKTPPCGIVEVKKASVADLMKVDNINKKVAEAIYSALYNE